MIEAFVKICVECYINDKNLLIQLNDRQLTINRDEVIDYQLLDYTLVQKQSNFYNMLSNLKTSTTNNQLTNVKTNGFTNLLYP